MFNNLDGFGLGQMDDENNGGVMGASAQSKKITVNLEDAYLEEQKLYQILEVSTNSLPFASL